MKLPYVANGKAIYSVHSKGNRDVGLSPSQERHQYLGMESKTTEMLSSVWSTADKSSFRETGIYFQY